MLAVRFRKAHVREHVGLGPIEYGSKLRELVAQLIGNDAPLRDGCVEVLLSEDRVDHREHHLPLALPGVSERIAFTRSSMSAHSRDTWLLLIPVIPIALTSSSTDLVETPWLYRLLDHSRERLLASSPRLKEARELAAFAQLRDLQVDGPSSLCQSRSR